MPAACLIFNTCAFGLEMWLFLTHITRLTSSFAYTAFAHSWDVARHNVVVRTGSRIMWFTGVKALCNTVLVVSGIKRPPRFKLTRKAGAAKPEDGPDLGGAADGSIGASSDDGTDGKRGSDGVACSADAEAPATVHAKERTYALHAAVSRVTELRRKVMLLNGTWDVWVLLVITGLNLAAVVFGLLRLQRKGAFSRFGAGGENVIWLGVAFAFVDAVRPFDGLMVQYAIGLAGCNAQLCCKC
jgi:hypothetical protein